MQGIRTSQPEELPDFFLQGMPMHLTTARAYFLVKHMHAWGAQVELHPWDTWDKLADRLETRLGYHIWHPWHWQEAARTRQGGTILRVLDDTSADEPPPALALPHPPLGDVFTQEQKG
jgi:hypothetical protein